MSRRSTRLSVLLCLLIVAGVAPVRAADPAELDGTGGDASPAVTDASPSPADPPATDAATPDAPAAEGDPERFIVVLDPGTNVAATAERHEDTLGADVEREFRRLGAYVAELTEAEAEIVEQDSAVAAVVPDEPIELTADTIPTGVVRISGVANAIASINGLDERVDADVAVVDTGIDPTHPDLNVVGGYNCTSSDRAAWSDGEGHGTHVAGTVGALDNGIGVVGVAPGVRLWSVRILNSGGFGYLSWYACGLDWIAGQRDPADPSRPLFEAANMSVTKWGSDDAACGRRNNDILHAAICRVVDGGTTVVAAAANDSGPASKRVPAAYNEVITVSALADTDGLPGGAGGASCFSWSSYDRDDTFADFSNYGGDVDIIAPGKCIFSTLRGNRYGTMSGTSMAAPHVAGAVALYKATRPTAKPSEVRSALRYLGTMNWATATDPDSTNEPLLDVAAVAALGEFSIAAAAPVTSVPEAGGTVQVPVTLARSSTFFEGVGLSAAATGPLSVTVANPVLYGWSAISTSVNVTVPRGTPAGSYPVAVTASNWGRVSTVTANVTVLNDIPSVGAPRVAAARTTLGTAALPVTVSWPAATDLSSAIDTYEVETSVDGGPWVSGGAIAASTRAVSVALPTGSTLKARIRARDAAANWSEWVESRPYGYGLVDDRSTAVRWSGTWTSYPAGSASGGSARYSTRAGASATHAFTGSGVALVMPKGPTRGHARVFLDGVLAGTINLYRASGVSRQIVFSRTWATEGTHSVTVQVVGTSGRPRVDLDAIVVLQ